MDDDTPDLDEDTGISTQKSVSGFVVEVKPIGQTKDGDAVLTMRVGQEHFVQDTSAPEGYRQIENTYFNVVQYGKAAERAAAQFRPGDRFIAEGSVKGFQFTSRDGEEVKGHEFVARKLGHDTAWTRYQVDRSPRTPSAAREGIAAEQGMAAESPDLAGEEPVHQTATKSAPRGKKPAAIPADGVAAEPELAVAGADIPF